MTICFVSETIDPSNGSGRFAFSMISRLQSDFGVKPVILMCRNEVISIPGAKPILFRSTFGRLILNPFLITWYARGTDLIHAFDGWPCLIMTYLASLFCRKQYTTSLYATYAVEPLLNPKQSYLIRAAYTHSRLNAAISRITAERIREAWSKANIEVINQGITYSDYQTSRHPLLPSDKKYVLTVASIKSRKGYHTAIPTMTAVLKKHPNLFYVIIAKREPTQNYYKQIINLIARSGVSDRIIWMENLTEEQLIAAYQYAEVFFLPSVSQKIRGYFEGFGSVFLEAQSCGTPVVTSRGGGQEDALTDGKTGYLIDEGNIDQAIERLNQIIDSPTLRSDLSSQARLFAQSMDWSNVLTTYYARFKAIIGTQRTH